MHHIDGEGADGGVVYAEMQQIESNMASWVNRRMKNLLYAADSGYRAEAGGRLPALRDLCSNERVRQFHSRFYQLANANVIVCGAEAQHEAIGNIVKQFEDTVMADSHFGEFITWP